MRVFISYSSRDGKNYAKKLYSTLSKRGHDPFFADHDICPSKNIWDIISKECLERDLSIFIITPLSRESKGQKQEYDLVSCNYITRMAFLNEKNDEAFEAFPLLKPYCASIFNDSNFEEKCEELSSQLVRLQDKEKMVPEARTTRLEEAREDLPTLSQEGLDPTEISRCIRNLNESYQDNTIIPQICRTKPYEKKPPSLKFTDIFINIRLPREWFSNKPFSNDVMFRQFGRNIALGEQRYIQDQILSNGGISRISGDLTPDSILSVVKEIRDAGFESDVIFTPIQPFIEMHHWRGRANVRYSRVIPKLRLDASLVVEGLKFKIVPSIGDMPLRDIIVLSSRAIVWRVRKYPKFGALFIALGNDRLHPKNWVEVIAKTTINCEINPKGVAILKLESNKLI